MTRYPVRWTEVAMGDVERLAAYLAEPATLRPERIINRIVDRGESLRTSPARGRIPPELRLVQDPAWRALQIPPWRILYRIVGRVVEIHGVLDGRRSLQDILMERLLPVGPYDSEAVHRALFQKGTFERRQSSAPRSRVRRLSRKRPRRK